MKELAQNIIDSAVDGDKMAFRSVVLHYGKAVNQLAFRFSANSACAEDITQECFIKIFKAINGFKHDAKFSTWLFRITTNTAIDYLRKQKKLKNNESIDHNPVHLNHVDPKITAENQLDLNQQLQNAFVQLSDIERTAFTMKHYQGYSIKEIAESLKINSNACKQTIYRAVQKLRKNLSPVVRV